MSEAAARSPRICSAYAARSSNSAGDSARLVEARSAESASVVEIRPIIVDVPFGSRGARGAGDRGPGRKRAPTVRHTGGHWVNEPASGTEQHRATAEMGLAYN